MMSHDVARLRPTQTCQRRQFTRSRAITTDKKRPCTWDLTWDLAGRCGSRARVCMAGLVGAAFDELRRYICVRRLIWPAQWHAPSQIQTTHGLKVRCLRREVDPIVWTTMGPN